MKARISVLLTVLAMALSAIMVLPPLTLGAPISPIPKLGNQGQVIVDVSPARPNVRPKATNTLRIKERTPTSITLKWHDASDFEDGNRLFRHTSRESFMRDAEEITDLGSLNSADGWEEYQDTGVGPHTPYCYQVRPYNTYGTSYSNIACEHGPVRFKLRVLTHNVFGQPEADCEKRATQLGADIAWSQPAYDIVAVQEYFDTTDAGLRSCSSKHLKDAITGPPEYRYRNSDNRYLFKPTGEWYQLQADGGVGIFTLHSIEQHKEWEWDNAPHQFRVQGFIFARIRIPNTPVTVDTYVVHPHSKGEGCDLDCNRSNMQQLADTISRFSRTSGNPVLVMGDFNIDANPDGNPAYQAIMDALHGPRDLWKEAHPNADPTEGYTKDHCGTVENYECEPGVDGKRIDYIFVPTHPSLTSSPYEIVIVNPDDVRVIKWTYLPDEYPYFRHRVSDHFGLGAAIEIRDRWSGYEDTVTKPGASLERPNFRATVTNPLRQDVSPLTRFMLPRKIRFTSVYRR